MNLTVVSPMIAVLLSTVIGMLMIAAFALCFPSTSRTRRWLSRPRVHRAFTVAALSFTVGAFCMLTAACAVPTWIADANRIIPIALDAAMALIASIAALSGNPELEAGVAAMQAIAVRVEAGLRDLNALIESYKSTPNEGLLQKIEEVANLVVGDLNQLLGDFGVPPAIAGPIKEAAKLLVGQVEAWLTLLPALNPKPAVGSALVITVPHSAAAFKQAFNAALSASTGLPAVDAALATVKRLSV